ncbi:MAG: hypothetical protein JNL74_04425 [Fibrobacteres bacterium]|nr:hypothetical protein [Fibrobacterota bacterium]
MMKKLRFMLIFALFGLFLILNCSSMSCKRFKSEEAAFLHILKQSNPEIIAFGEYHQQEETSHISSTLSRFMKSILPILSSTTSDIIIETWIPDGNCGKAEEQASAGIEETISRPETTQDELVDLIIKSDSLKIKPHILKLSCEEYDNMLLEDGDLDYDTLMNLVTRKISEKACSLFNLNVVDIERKQRVIIYGGAMHNDVKPDSGYEDFSFADKLQKSTKGSYLEIDLIVPEFAEAASDSLMQTEEWYKIMHKNANPNSVLLINPRPYQYIIVLKSTSREPQPVR